MKMHTVQQIHAFLDVISKSAGPVWAEDDQGKSYDLKNEFILYRVIGEMIGENGRDLQLYASNPNDERRLIDFLMRINRGAA